jgi:streptomycin 6-kinase
VIPADHHRIDARTWELVRAWPRPSGDVPLELARIDDDGTRRGLVGRWYPDADAAARERARIDGARLGDDPRLLLQPDGADRKLPGLAPSLAAGATLIAHRPGKRAVVRTPDGRFVKFVRDGRTATMARRHRQLARALGETAVVPPVLDARDDALVLEPMPGHPPLQRDAAGSERDFERVGRMLGRLAQDPGDNLPVHDALAEADVTRGWVERAARAGRLPTTDVEHALRALIAQPGTPLTCAHRDLHDGQLLLTDDRLVVLDPDTLSRAEPALDLANLLVHLDLRVAQGLLSPAGRTRARAAILRAAAPSTPTLRRLEAYDRACRLRLAAVYAFRPRWHALAQRWFADTLASSA